MPKRKMSNEDSDYVSGCIIECDVKKTPTSANDDSDDCILNEPDISVVIIDQDDEVSDSNQTSKEIAPEEPLLKILFKNNETFSMMREDLTNYLKKALISINKHGKFIENVVDGSISIIETDNCSEDESLFIHDTEPDIKKRRSNVPFYYNGTQILNDEIPQKKIVENNKNTAKKTNKCFNCDGDHNLMDCSEPRNHTKISQARKNFNCNNERYHERSDQKYGHFIPGQISDTLEKALGIRHYEIPIHIYKMRNLGYPPGWLEEAKVSHSGLMLIDSDQVNNDKEIDESKIIYNVKKIISYPGYNCETKSSMHDEYRRYDSTPMLPKHSKKALIEMLNNSMKPLKKSSEEITPEKNTLAGETTNLSITDMDMDDEEGEIHDEQLLPPGVDDTILGSAETVNILTPERPFDIYMPEIMKDTPVEKIIEYDNNLSNRSISPTLLDLHKKQKQLLKDLELDTTNISTSVDDSLIDDIMELEAADNTINNDNSIVYCETPTNSSRGTSMSTENGTPIFKFSPYNKLPSQDAFGIGVSEVINFENLPDSTGAYNKLKKVITKVRTKLIEINNENL